MPERSINFEAATPDFLSTTNSGTFGSEEWEGWMKWDSLAEPTSPKGSDLSPPSLQFNSGSTGSTSPSDFDSLPSINFSPVYSISESTKTPAPSKKRKSSAITNGAAPSTRQPRGQKISHNVIEKRYRSNLNDKIAKLRDSVPELRTATPTVKKRNTAKGAAGRDSEGSDDEEAGLKFNKATVLTKATEYIQQLERQNQRLLSEVSQLKSRGGNVDKLRNPPAITTGSAAIPTLAQPIRKGPKISPGSDGTVRPAAEAPPVGMIQVPEELRRFREANVTTEHYGHTFPSSLPAGDSLAPFPEEPVRGMIPLADDFRRLREEGTTQAHYAPEVASYYGNYVSPQDTVLEEVDVDTDETASRWPRSKAMSRVLVGSLVGLMFMESFSEQEDSSADQGSGISARGLFSLPADLRTESRGFRAQIRKRIITFYHSPHAGHAARILLFSTLFLTMVFLLFMYFAPRGSKNVREGPVVDTQAQSSSEDSNTADSAKQTTLYPSTLGAAPNDATSNVHPLNQPLEGTQPVTLVRLGLERIVNEWFGLDWLRSHHLDEEAFKRAGTRLDEGDGSKDWPDIKQLVPQFMQNNS